MRLFKQGLPHSLSALLLGPDGFRRQPEARGVDPVEPVRQALLDALTPDGQSLNPDLSRRLRLLHDAQALWFARSEVVATLSRRYGEAEAVAQVQRLLPLFEGLVPASLIASCRVPGR
ncbi:hypothetical protein [uncultured Hydrogenophaga sp.]|uniref:hypothetical protein n=1 Tax=uncultured Hydrogenophaga sp. TaxID=199683 RepID=UPI00265E9416|nr:hypothetical protein [uncultured Hydrogenophaga sp.]